MTAHWTGIVANVAALPPAPSRDNDEAGTTLVYAGASAPTARASLALSVRFHIKNEEFCIKNERLCIKNEESCVKNDEFCRSLRTPARAGARRKSSGPGESLNLHLQPKMHFVTDRRSNGSQVGWLCGAVFC